MSITGMTARGCKCHLHQDIWLQDAASLSLFWDGHQGLRARFVTFGSAAWQATENPAHIFPGDWPLSSEVGGSPRNLAGASIRNTSLQEDHPPALGQHQLEGTVLLQVEHSELPVMVGRGQTTPRLPATVTALRGLVPSQPEL